MSAPKYYSAKKLGEIFERDPHTIRDWINKGCPTPDGPVKLQAVKLGKSWQVKDEWLAVFELRVRPELGRPDLELKCAGRHSGESQ
jgi:hypothetical protein